MVQVENEGAPKQEGIGSELDLCRLGLHPNNVGLILKVGLVQFKLGKIYLGQAWVEIVDSFFKLNRT